MTWFFLCIHTGAADPHAALKRGRLLYWTNKAKEFNPLFTRRFLSLWFIGVQSKHTFVLLNRGVTLVALWLNLWSSTQSLGGPWRPLCLHMEVVWHSLLGWMPSAVIDTWHLKEKVKIREPRQWAITYGLKSTTNDSWICFAEKKKIHQTFKPIFMRLGWKCCQKL